jgi:hypothetical protein
MIGLKTKGSERMTSIKVASSDDLLVINEAARRGWLGRTLPEGAADLLSEGAAHILAPVGGAERYDLVSRKSYQRVRASVALKGEAYPAECFLDVREDYWEMLMEAGEALRLAKLSAKWRPESPCARAEKLRSAA